MTIGHRLELAATQASIERLDPDIAILDGVAVVLEQDAARPGLRQVRCRRAW